MNILLRFVCFHAMLLLSMVSCDNKNYLKERGLKRLADAQQKCNEEQFDEALMILDGIEQAETGLAERIDSLKLAVLNEKQTYTNEYMLANRRDTIFMDFVFGSSRKENQRRINDLIKSGEFRAKDDYTFRIGMQGYYTNVTLNGYKIDFFVNEYSCEGLVNFHYFDEKLYSLEVILFSCPDDKDVQTDVKKMYTDKYGTSKKQSAFYNENDETYDNIRAFWRESNKAIIVSEVGAFVGIQYEDILVKQEKDSLAKSIEDIRQEYRELKTEETKGKI